MAEIGEFARRLCERGHAMYRTVGPTPCGQHTADAQRLWGLLKPGGTAALQTIVAIRREDGTDMDDDSPLEAAGRQFVRVLLGIDEATVPSSDERLAYQNALQGLIDAAKVPAKVPAG